MSEERDDLSERVALFRHRLIARLLPQELTPGQRQREIARIVAGEHQIPGTMRTRVAESTLRDWLRDYRASGFEALKPKTHRCRPSPRLASRGSRAPLADQGAGTRSVDSPDHRSNSQGRAHRH